MSDYRNPASMKEKAQVLANDRRQNTMHGRALTELDQLMQGRFAKPTEVTGTEATPEAFPAAEWTRQDTGLEPVLGYSIEDQEPTGTQNEVQASIRRAGAADPSPPRSAIEAPATDPPLADVVRSVGAAADEMASPRVGAAPISTKPPTVYRRPV
jgi:hypothetical protein